MAYSEIHDIAIAGMATAVPQNKVESSALWNRFGEDAVDALPLKYGTKTLHIALPEQTASDLGFIAAREIIGRKQIDIEQVGAIIFASRTPDYRSPATACVLQSRLGIPEDCVAFDLALGCNGFISGLQAVGSLLFAINKRYALLIVGDTTSKQLSENNPLSLLFGDGAAAVLFEKKPSAAPFAVEIKANGDGFRTIIIPGGGFRFHNPLEQTEERIDIEPTAFNEMNIDENAFHSFAVSEMPVSIKDFVSKRKAVLRDFDFLALHQPGLSISREIAKELQIPFNALPFNLAQYGNTSGNSIPLLICDYFGGEKNKEIRVLACAYGEGLSWGMADFMISAADIFPVIETDAYFEEGSVSHDF